MDNVIYAINNQTFHKNISITCGDAIIFTVQLSEEAISMVYSCAGNLHGDNYEFKKELGDGIIELENHNYQIIVNSTDTINLIQGIYNHNLRVETSGGVYTIMDGLIFIESDIGELKLQGGNPIFINYNSYIDGTITNAIVISAEIIPEFMFYECKDLINVYFSNNITSIESRAFYNCTNLALTSLPNGVASIGNSAFYNCTNLALTSLPNGVTSIGNSAFYNCTNLALTSLPNGVTSIGDSAFASCTNLALTSLPDGVTFIGAGVFYNCTNLALTSLPNGVTSIRDSAFNNCTNLALTSLPDGVTSIGNWAFYNCTKLTSLTFMGKPNSIAINAFRGCTNLINIYVPWSQGEVANAPWGANNATIHYNS